MCKIKMKIEKLKKILRRVYAVLAVLFFLGAVVYSFAIMGSPAKVVRELTDAEVLELYASAKRYVNFKENYRSTNA